MAICLSVRRVCSSAVRLAPRLQACPPSRVHARLPAQHHLPIQYHILNPAGSKLGSSPGAGGPHICQRSFFTKWSSTSSSSHAKKELKDKNNYQETTKDSIKEDYEEEESIIPTTDEKGQPLSNWSRMKIMMKAYGYVIIPVHWIIAPVWFGTFYYTIKMGIDIGPFLSAIGVSDHHVESMRNSKASTALMAYALYKIFTPLRYTLTLGATEMTIRKLRRMGYMRPHPPKEKSYRDSFKETVTEVRDKMKDRQDSRNT